MTYVKKIMDFCKCDEARALRMYHQMPGYWYGHFALGQIDPIRVEDALYRP